MKLLRRLRALFAKEKLDRDMSDEMRTHLELQTAENLRRGLAPDDARRAAQRAFGGVEQVKERCRDQRREGIGSLENLSKDVRYAVRGILRAPGFAIAAVASLAIGIGATTAMFSIVNTVLLRPLPYPDASGLVTFWQENAQTGQSRQTSGLGSIEDWRRLARSFEAIAAYDLLTVTVTSGEPRRVSAARVTPNLAAVLRTQPLVGSMFSEEAAAARESVAVISHASWQTQHGGTPDILGRRIEIDGRPTSIVGVMPPDFSFPDKDTEIWVPHTFLDSGPAPVRVRGVGPWRVIARLAPAASAADAAVEMTRLSALLAKEYPVANAGLNVQLISLVDVIVGPETQNALLLLLAAVGAVLLIACSNVGNLLLARGLTRQREFALRLSLGATRRRLVAQLLIEALVLCLFAAALGLGLASLAIDGVKLLGPANLPRLAELGLDLRMLAFTLAVSIASTAVFGLLPALQSTRRDPHTMLREGARGSTDAPRGRRLRSALVTVEIAVALVLFAGAGMLVRSLTQLLAVDPGFRIDDIRVVNIRLSADRAPADALPFAAATVLNAAAIPGVTAAAISEEVMLGERGQQTVLAERTAPGETTSLRGALSNDAVTPEYFSTLDVPLRDGRVFGAVDVATAPSVAVVNETLARQLWPDERAVGRRFRIGPPNIAAPWTTVVGVVGDQRRQGLARAPIPQVFVPLAQRPTRSLNLILRTELPPEALRDAVRRAVHAVDARVPVGSITTLRQQLDRGIAPQRFHTRLLGGFAVVALVLAGVGIFGLMHYAVARRTHEIGVRSALGASASQILRHILREGLVLAGLGVALGLAATLALGQAIRGLLFEVSPADPWSLAAACGALFTMAALACLLPALRASRIDPMLALRSE